MSLYSVGLVVLSADSGPQEDVDEFYRIAEEKYPDRVVHPTEDTGYEMITAKLKRLNKENRESGEQKHRRLVVKEAHLADNFEDAGREETEYFVVVLTPFKDEEEYEELLDKLSDLFNFQGILSRSKEETMEEFVTSVCK